MEEAFRPNPTDIARCPCSLFADVVTLSLYQVRKLQERPHWLSGALEMALASSRQFFFPPNTTRRVDDTDAQQIYRIGTICLRILPSQRQENGQIKVIFEGRSAPRPSRVTTTRGVHGDRPDARRVSPSKSSCATDALVSEIAPN